MARSTVAPQKASLGKSIGRVLLLDTTGTDLSSVSQQIASENLHIQVPENSPQAFKLFCEASYDLVVAGPRLDKLSLDSIGAGAGSPQPEMQRLVPALTSLYQARDQKEFLVRLVAAAALIIDSQQVFAFSCDAATGAADVASLSVHRTCPANQSEILRQYLARITALEHAADMAGATHPSGEMGPQLWMAPVIHDSRLQAFMGFVSPPQAASPTRVKLEMLRLLSEISGPFLGVLRDMQTLRRRSEQAEAIVHLRSHLLSNLAHEFRSLLAAVQGYARRVIGERAGAINDAQRDHLTVVLRNADKLLDLVSHSLPFVAEQELRVESFDLRVIWPGVLKRAQRRIAEKSAKIREQIPLESFTVVADKDRLAVALDILLASALQCANDQGEVTAQFLRGVHGEVTFRLFASGGGLPPQLVDTAFEHHDKFSTGTASDRLRGLSLVHDMIWLHGGRVSVTSNLGEGAIFTFTLPPPLAEQKAEA